MCTGAVHFRTSYHRVMRYVKDFRPSDLRLRPSERVEVVFGAGASSSGARSSKSRTSSSKRCPCRVRRTTSRLLRALLTSRLEPGAIAAPRRSHPISATAARTRHSINKLRRLEVPPASPRRRGGPRPPRPAVFSRVAALAASSTASLRRSFVGEAFALYRRLSLCGNQIVAARLRPLRPWLIFTQAFAFPKYAPKSPAVASVSRGATSRLRRPLRPVSLLFCTIVACVEINQCVGCTRQFFFKSFLGDDAADLARSSGEEPASPRHRAGVASMAWRTTR